MTKHILEHPGKKDRFVYVHDNIYVDVCNGECIACSVGVIYMLLRALDLFKSQDPISFNRR